MDYAFYFDIFCNVEGFLCTVTCGSVIYKRHELFDACLERSGLPYISIQFVDIGKHLLKNNSVYLEITNEYELTTCTENKDPPHLDIIPRTWTLM